MYSRKNHREVIFSSRFHGRDFERRVSTERVTSLPLVITKGQGSRVSFLLVTFLWISKEK